MLLASMYDNSNKENHETLSQGINFLADNIEGFQLQDYHSLSVLPEMPPPNTAEGFLALRPDIGGTSAASFPDVSQIIPWTISPSIFNPARDLEPCFAPPFNRRTGFGYDIEHQFSAPFGLHAELQKMTAQEIMDAKALAASKSHSEAERRRRERINNHLQKLRSLLPNTTKTDKASLLAEVIQHVKELKRQTSLIAETSHVPTEVDELTVDNADEDGRQVIRASICCEDRSDLLTDLIQALKDLRLKTLKAEITTLGGRVKNVLFVTGEDDEEGDQVPTLASIHEALKAVMEKPNGDESGSGNVKRQRTNISIL